MGCKIIEKHLSSKTGNMAECEDLIHESTHFIAVIDGATTKGKASWHGETSGRYAAKLINATLNQLSAKADVVEFIEQVNQRFQEAYKAFSRLELAISEPVERLTAATAVFSKHRREVWLIGDCQCLLNGEVLTTPKKVDDVNAAVRSFFLNTELRQGKTVNDLLANDTGRAFIMPLLKRQSFFQNHDHPEWGFAVIDGFPIPEEKIRVVSIPPDAKFISLASDGYPVVKATLAASEQALADVLEADPLLIGEYPSTKSHLPGNASFDDRAYVRIGLL